MVSLSNFQIVTFDMLISVVYYFQFHRAVSYFDN